MKHYLTIDQRVLYYDSYLQEHPEAISLSVTPELSEKYHLERPGGIAEDRRITEDLSVFLSLYHREGIEYAIHPGYTLKIHHSFPLKGVLHKHGFIEILYVIDGSFDQILMGEHLHFEKGDFVITDQNCEHADYLQPVDGSVVFIQLRSGYMNALLHSNEQSDELQRFLFHALDHQKREQSFLLLKENAALEDDTMDVRAETLYLLEALFSEARDYKGSLLTPGNSDIQKGLLTRLLRHMCISYSPILHSSSQESKDLALLYELERYIRLHYATVTSAELEDVFHYHRNYYNLLLRKYRGMTFKQYLLQVRLSLADSLLSATDLPVKEIARQVGYENTSHFYHLYEDQFGKKPRA